MRGGPRIGHCVVMSVVWFVLGTGCRWEDQPNEMGCSERTARRPAPGRRRASGTLARDLPRLLRQAGKQPRGPAPLDGVMVRALGASRPAPALSTELTGF